MQQHTQPLRADKKGVRVECVVCGQMKCPRGRDGGLYQSYCDRDCSGYNADPQVGSLWPGESEEAFGFPVSDVGTKV
jgi:hypothetical protein